MSEPKKRRKATSPEELERRFPALSHLAGPSGKATKRAWVAVFSARPDAMHALLADFIKQAHAQPGKIGQRPMPREEQVDFEGLVYGEENDLPLTEILPKIVRKSERAMSAELHMSRAQYQRMLKGAYEPDVSELRLLAKAIGKPPTFFVEYRKTMATAAFVNLINDNPGIATALYRRYLEVRV